MGQEKEQRKWGRLWRSKMKDFSMWLWWEFWWTLPQVTIIWVVSLTRGAVLVALLDVGRPTLNVRGTFWLQPWNIGMAEGRQVLYCLLCFSLVTWFTLWLLLQMPSVTPEPTFSKLPLWVKDLKPLHWFWDQLEQLLSGCWPFQYKTATVGLLSPLRNPAFRWRKYQILKYQASVFAILL